MTPQHALRYHHNPAEIIESLESHGFAIVSAVELDRLRAALNRIADYDGDAHEAGGLFYSIACVAVAVETRVG